MAATARKTTTSKTAATKAPANGTKARPSTRKTATANTSVELVLDFVKDTKRTFVFGSDAEDAPITSLYVTKAGLGTDTAPSQIKVTIVSL